jgi:hypothetical protein
MGLATSRVQIRAEALGGIGNTMVVGPVVYFDGKPFIAVDTFTSAPHNIIAYTITLFGGIDIFACFTLVQEAYKVVPTQPVLDAETTVEAESRSTISGNATEFHMVKTLLRPSPPFEEETVLENRYPSALQFRRQDCDQHHFVGHINTILGSPKDSGNHESKAINKEYGDSYSDVSTSTTPVH